MATKIKTVDFDEVREYYERNRPAGHWFDKDTLKFWGCRLPKVAYETNAGMLFISSELDSDRTRAEALTERMAELVQ